MGDADAALGHLGAATLLGRGLGAYVALLAAGARPDLVRGAILADGPGIGRGRHAGRVRPTSRTSTGTPPPPPDPYALAELSRDIRPPDYAVELRPPGHRVVAGSTPPIAVVARSTDRSGWPRSWPSPASSRCHCPRRSPSTRRRPSTRNKRARL